MSKPRPEPVEPIHHLLDQLHDLNILLNQPGERMKLLEAYDSFIRDSRNGRSCTYARKCQSVFTRKLLPDIKKQIQEIYDIIRTLDGSD